MAKGFGTQPFGTSPFGVGETDTTTPGGSTGIPTTPIESGPGGAVPSIPYIRIEAGFDVLPDASSSTFRLGSPTSGVLGTNTLGGSQVWQDISDYLKPGFTVTRTSDRTAGQAVRSYSPGVLTCTLKNGDRRFDPTNLAGPYVVNPTGSGTIPFTIGDFLIGSSSGGGTPHTQVEPMRPIRITAVMGAAEFPLFTGYVDTWGPEYFPPFYGESRVVASDYFKVLGKNDRASQAVTVGSGDYGGQRINRVLNNAGYTGDRDITRGNVQLAATDLGGNQLTEIQQVGQAEVGDVYVNGAGVVVFRSRIDAIRQAQSAISQATFGDGSAGGTPNELPMAGATIAYDESTLVNVAQVSRAGSDQVMEARDDSSVQRYQQAVYTSSDLPFLTDGAAADHAQIIVTTSSTPDLRITEIVIRPYSDPRLWAQALGRDIGDRVTVVLRPPGGGTEIRRDVVIRGVSHNVPDIKEWETTWQTATATDINYFVLGSATSGILGVNLLY